MLEIEKIPLDDTKTWNMIKKGNTTGVFQLESDLGKTWAKNIEPKNIHELSILISLIRPACLESGQTAEYARVKKGDRERFSFNDIDVDRILEPTFGILVFQEQLMFLGNDIAWKDYDEMKRLVIVDKLRKCLVGESLLMTNNGPKTLEQLSGEDISNVKVLSTNNDKLIFTKLNKVWPTKIDYTIKLSTQNGYSVEGSKDHRVYTQDGWKDLKDITTEDCVLVPKNYTYKGRYTTSKYINKAIIAGYFVSEGCYTEKHTRPKITNKDQNIICSIITSIEKEFGENNYSLYNHNNGVTDIYPAKGARDFIIDSFDKAKSRDKQIPIFVLNGNKGITAAFIGSYFSGDGYVSEKNIGISSTSKSIICNLQILLLRYGIKSGVVIKNTTYNNKPYRLYELNISTRKYIAKFFKSFGRYICDSKLEKLQKILETKISLNNFQSEKIPKQIMQPCLINSDISYIVDRNKLGGSVYSNHITYDKAQYLNNYIGSDLLQDWLDAEYTFVPVKSITSKKKKKQLYDFEVENQEHCAFVNGILVHNSIGKKDSKLIQELKEEFVSGCIRNGKSEKLANELFQIIASAGRYAFNECICGDEKLKRDNTAGKFHPTIEEMYMIRNSIQYAKKTNHLELYKKWKLYNNYGKTLSLDKDGRLRLNIIEDIQFAGQREVFKITLEDNSCICVTGNHKFPTTSGIKTIDSGMRIGDCLYVCDTYDDTSKKYGWSRITKNEISQKILPIRERKHKEVGFLCGQYNPGYSNGEYTKWKTNIGLLEDHCYICGISNTRLEVDHIDGNRENNEIENLQKLCCSCHKKKEYCCGRTKKGEKGYCSKSKKIIKIQSVGIKNTYNVTMAYPNHTFTTSNNIVTCNSHAKKYALLGYRTAYLKANYPYQFYATYMSYSKDKPKHHEELRRLIYEAKMLGIKIDGPSLIECNREFKISKIDDKFIIRYGLVHVKNISNSDIDLLQKEKDNIKNWFDIFMLHFDQERKIKLRSPALLALIKCGALDQFKIQREVLKNIYILMKDQLSNGELLYIVEHKDEVNTPEDFKILIEKCAKEKSTKKRRELVLSESKELDMGLIDDLSILAKEETLAMGLPITVSPTENKQSASNKTCQDCFHFSTNNKYKKYIISCVIDNIIPLVTKRGSNPGQKMCQIEVSDKTGQLKIACFPNEYEKLSNKFHEKLIYDMEIEGTGGGWCLKNLKEI